MILMAVSGKRPTDPAKFHEYCQETAELLVSLYPWYKMPVSVNLLLIHGAQILGTSILPIGMMSKEAQEARNKDNKQFQLHHARKTSRGDTMSDVFHRLMVTGDVVISSRSLKTPKTRPLPCDVKHMLQHTTPTNTSDTFNSESD